MLIVFVAIVFWLVFSRQNTRRVVLGVTLFYALFCALYWVRPIGSADASLSGALFGFANGAAIGGGTALVAVGVKTILSRARAKRDEPS